MTIKRMADWKREVNIKQAEPAKIMMYDHGVTLQAAKVERMKPRSGGGKRGEIQGWSMASRRRMRVFMLTHRPAEGRRVFNVTLTIPGEVVDFAKQKEVFDRWSIDVSDSACSAVWRAEVQRRGMLHWHILFTTPDAAELKRRRSTKTVKLTFPSSLYLQMQHIELSSCEYDDVLDRAMEWIVKNSWLCALAAVFPGRELIQGAYSHSCNVQSAGPRGRDPDARWMRYLCDHCSKAKAAQVGNGIGRHWGIIGRKYFQLINGKDLNLTISQYHFVRRSIEKLKRSWIKTAAGKRLKLSPRRAWGRIGSQACFIAPETMRRLCALSMSSCPSIASPE